MKTMHIVQKKSARPAMSLKSPSGNKTPAKAAGMSKAKHCMPNRTSLLTKQDKMQARLRARKWARNTLGRKKSASSPPQPLRADSSRMIVIDVDDDDDEEEDSKFFVNGNEFAGAASVATREKAQTALKRDSPRECASRLDIESLKTTETSAFAGIRADESIEEEDVFYDAFEYLPSRHDVTLEEVSAQEDDEIRDLRTARRNRAPDHGVQWMEPLEPVGVSFSTFVPKADP